MSVMRSIRAFYNGCNKIQYKLFPPVVLLGIVLIILRWSSSPPAGRVWVGQGNEGMGFTQLDDTDISSYIAGMKDSRSEDCKNEVFHGLGSATVSILLDFVDHEFYDLKLTLEAILEHTPDELYKEIIILDDGTGHDNVQNDAIKYLGQPKFKKVRGFRSEKSEGAALSRFKASKMATGSILVFISSQTAVNVGWLEPLINQVTQNHKQIVVSHSDALLANYRYFRTPDSYISVFDWTLNTLFMESDDPAPIMKMPAMAGHAFAVDTMYFNSIGNYDEGFGRGGGENLELSFRTWMCGGSIVKATCSRVAVRDALVVQKVQSEANFRRLTELWLGQGQGQDFRRTAYRIKEIDAVEPESEKQNRVSRQKYLSRTTQCQDINWYLREAAPQVLRVPLQSRHFGKLRAATGYCLHGQAKHDGTGQLTVCRPHMYEANMVWNLDVRGRLSHEDKCVENDSGQALIKKCQEKPVNTQIWARRPDGQMQSFVDNSLCLTHEAAEDGSHKLILLECPVEDDRSTEWSFIKY